MESKMSATSVKLNKIKDFVKANVQLQCAQAFAPRLAIQGAPGTGKSDIIREICEENGWCLNVKYISNMSLEQITGLPAKVENGSTAIWTRPELFNFDNPEYAPSNYLTTTDTKVKDNTVKVLLIDDFHLADRMIQKYLFQLLTYKSLNGYHLPPNTAILLAGNRNTDKACANVIPAPVCNRMIFVEVHSDVEDWLLNFAFKHGIRSDITSYLHQHGDARLSSDPQESAAWASPRSWTYLSYQMDQHEKMFGKISMDDLKIIASGLIGNENAMKFIEYRELFAKWNFDQMFKNSFKSISKDFADAIETNPSEVYSIINSAISWLLATYRNNEFNITNENVVNAAEFVYRILTFLITYKNAKSMRNIRPLIAAGLKFIHVFQNSVSDFQKTKNTDLLNMFCSLIAKNSTDTDWIFYDLLLSVFDIKNTDPDELKRIEEAKKNLGYTL